MTVGTLGFVKERLTEARESLGLTKVALSELLDVTPMAISQYEAGSQTPRPEVLDRISDKLGFPRTFFMRAALADEAEPIFWRSNAAATKVARQRGLQRLRWGKELVLYLHHFFEFPKVDFPDDLFWKGDFRELSNKDIESIAARVREFWGFGNGPVPDLLLELENSGAITCRINLASETLDAFSQWSTQAGIPFVVLGKDGSAVRSRFDAAHELGHLLLHRGVDRKRINATDDFKLIEKQAHAFAAAFLLPARSFADELWTPSLDGFLALKERWKVSISMMIMRAESTGITEKEETQRFYINYNRRGWRSEEPLDAVLKHEEPKILRRSFEALIREGLKSREQITEELALPAREIEQIGALPSGFLTGAQAEVKAFPALRDGMRPARTSGGGQVVNIFDRKKT